MEITNELVLSLLNSQGISKVVEHLVRDDLTVNVKSLRIKVLSIRTRHATLKEKALRRRLSDAALLTEFLNQPFVFPKLDASKS